MKAILLAAGEGRRMRPLTLTRPKQMVDILGRPLIHWIIEALPAEITELVIVVGYKGELIRKSLGSSFAGRPITYVTQEKPTGSAEALLKCKPLIAEGERFLLLHADDLHGREGIERLLKHPLSILVSEHVDPSRFGVVVADAKGRVVEFIEKPKQPKSNLVNAGACVLDSRIFRYTARVHENGERYLTDAISQLLNDADVVIEHSVFWHPISMPVDIEKAERHLESKEVSHPTRLVILAGGMGTRMPANEKHLPKHLVEVAGKTILERQLEHAVSQGIRHITLALGHKSEASVEWLKKYNHPGVTVDYVIEKTRLGTGGGIRFASQGITEPFLAINSDNLSDFQYRSMIRHGGDGNHAVICGIEVNDASDYGTIEHDDDLRITAFREKRPGVGRGIVNTGCYLLRPSDVADMPEAFSIEYDLFPRLAVQRHLVLCRHAGNYWFDCGTEDRLKIVRDYFQENSK